MRRGQGVQSPTPLQNSISLIYIIKWPKIRILPPIPITVGPPPLEKFSGSANGIQKSMKVTWNLTDWLQWYNNQPFNTVLIPLLFTYTSLVMYGCDSAVTSDKIPLKTSTSKWLHSLNLINLSECVPSIDRMIDSEKE